MRLSTLPVVATGDLQLRLIAVLYVVSEFRIMRRGFRVTGRILGFGTA